MRVTILGGDARSEALAQMLAGDGHGVTCYGLSARIARTSAAETPAEACLGADMVIGPTPCLKNGLFNAPSLDRPLHPDEVLPHITRNTCFVAGAIPESLRSAFRDIDAPYYDFMDDETLAQANAVPSAEGAIGLAMQRMSVTLAGARAVVLGYGRIGQVLARMLRGIGAHTAVYARREEVLERAWQDGADAVDGIRLPNALSEADCVFNTIPSKILNARLLAKIDPQCVILDLASAPGGTDFEAANALGLNASLELGLPGRVAPRSAALYMKQALYRLPYREFENENNK